MEYVFHAPWTSPGSGSARMTCRCTVTYLYGSFVLWGWRDSSVVRNTHDSHRGPHTPVRMLTANLSATPSSGLHGHLCWCSHGPHRDMRAHITITILKIIVITLSRMLQIEVYCYVLRFFSEKRQGVWLVYTPGG